MGQLVLLSGPSCVGKDPLLDALRRCRPDLSLGEPVIHTSRGPRPGEQEGREFHFRDAETIRRYDRERFFVYTMRGQQRAIDLDEVTQLLADWPSVIVQVHPPQVSAFRRLPRWRDAAVGVTAVLLQPLALEEVDALAQAGGCTPQQAVTDVMLPKQIHRALSQGKRLTSDELADLTRRAEAAWDEMRDTNAFDHVLVNHDAEGSLHWCTTPPIGDAGRTMAALAQVLAKLSARSE